MLHGADPEGLKLPIKLDSTSNGEYAPRPISRAAAQANSAAHAFASQAARKLGASRRAFLASSRGAAGTLFAMNAAFAQSGCTGGSYRIPADAPYDDALAASVLSGDEFIFDVQNHHVNPLGAWRARDGAPWERALRAGMPQARDAQGRFSMDPLGVDAYIRDVFLDSDTHLAVLSAVPAGEGDNPLLTEEAAITRALVDKLETDKRLLIHAGVQPQLAGALDGMERVARDLDIAAWKLYTQWGPAGGEGYWMTDERYGVPVLEKARALGIPVIAVHKGIPLPFVMEGDAADRYADPQDMGAAARAFPDLTFLVYHAGYDPRVPEGPYDPAEPAPTGVNRLVRTFEQHGLARTGNLYAEVGASWRLLMQDPDQAAHFIGKLLLHVGEDRILWGSDCIWFGSPQDQIQAFRTFEISPEFQERFGYPPLTAEARRKIFGLNAARVYRISPEEIRRVVSSDPVARRRAEYQNAPDPLLETWGPKTQAEFNALLLSERGG